MRNAVRAPVRRALLLRVARRVVAAEGLSGPLLLAIYLVDDETQRRINREQRGIDATTDVLSFPLLSELQTGTVEFALPPDEPRHLGEVVISYPRVREQAEAFGHGEERELCYLLAHGVLHVLGYDHVEPEEQRRMRAREEAALAPLGLTR